MVLWGNEWHNNNVWMENLNNFFRKKEIPQDDSNLLQWVGGKSVNLTVGRWVGDKRDRDGAGRGVEHCGSLRPFCCLCDTIFAGGFHPIFLVLYSLFILLACTSYISQ